MSEILKPARPADIDVLLPFMREYCEFDRIQFDAGRARLTMLARRLGSEFRRLGSEFNSDP